MQFLHFCHYFLTPNTLEFWLTIALLCPTSIGKGVHTHLCAISLTIHIWEICIQHFSHLSAGHIPDKLNVIADLASRKFQDSAEWMIFTDIFDRLCSIFGIPDIDLFASRLNKQLEHYVSWLKTASLIMLLSGHRVNTENLKITNIYTSETECTFVFRSVLKHSRPSYHQQPLILRSFPSNPSLCLVINITQYLKFRLEKSAYEGFFITTVPPYKQCSKDTIERWIKEPYLSLASTVEYTRPIVFV